MKPVYLPINRTRDTDCGHRQPTGPGYSCNRRPLHGGRHCFYYRRLNGLVRAVWGERADCDPTDW